ncbi:hypothetical protein DASC09_054950 [Saccharomycopsis crataegensis]|uniref:Uncharacterized protein n=1 Tax=Saccharomycopsis crataegensis TaxID=43959 RepID=A0AAV5QTV8_9ASCO|nr:hypothetical protein DASC09_054950 [Saccharomycopsis crataegensis]
MKLSVAVISSILLASATTAAPIQQNATLENKDYNGLPPPPSPLSPPPSPPSPNNGPGGPGSPNGPGHPGSHDVTNSTTTILKREIQHINSTSVEQKGFLGGIIGGLLGPNGPPPPPPNNGPGGFGRHDVVNSTSASTSAST